jgi:hypothetical protein
VSRSVARAHRYFARANRDDDHLTAAEALVGSSGKGEALAPKP